MNIQPPPASDMQIVTPTATAARERLPELVALLRDSVASGGSIGYVQVPEPPVVAAYWEDVLEAVAAERVILLLAVVGGRCVGAVQLHPCGKPNQPHRGEVAKLLVHSSFRRRGTGERLMREVETVARDRHLTLLTLDTLEGDAGERLYRRLGWIAAGAIPDYAIGTDGRLHATVVFYRRLGGAP